MRFEARLRETLARRRQNNPAYSLRAFAQFLGTDHSTLSQWLRGHRRVTRRSIQTIGPRLRMSAADIAECCALEDEACILTALEDRRFEPNSRWLAVTLNIGLDDVNIAIQRLLHRRVLRMNTPHTWEHAQAHG